MADEPDPPRVTYGFKPREFKRDNAPASEAGRMPTAAELAKVASSGKIVAAVPPAGPRPHDPNDVYATLQVNRAAEKETPDPSMADARKFLYRRKRDYWIVLGTGEAALGTVAFLTRHNSLVVICIVAGMAIFGVGLTWIMWQIMGRY
jgi:hypothetical protein